MIDTSSQQVSRASRRRRFSRARRIDGGGRSALRRGLARVGFHGLIVAVGLTAAVTVWNGTTDQRQVAGASVDGMSQVALSTGAADLDPAELLGDTATTMQDTTATPSDAEAAIATSTRATADTSSGPLEPVVRRVAQGDTIRSIAAEYSVSISTILASNKLDDPNMIQPGQDLLIPPVEGVVADVEPDETLGHLAERYHVEAIDVATANALPNDPDHKIPYERVVVPGIETAERAVGETRRQENIQNGQTANVDPSTLAKPSPVEYEVQEGDTIGQLSTQFGVTVWTILSANNLGDADLIRPGMKLKVLPVNGIQHEVQAGESLSDIASFYKVDLGPLIDFNAIADPDSLKVGSTLTIPGAERPQPTYSLAGASTGTPLALIAAAPAPSAPVAAAPAQPNVAAAQRSAAQSTLAQAQPAAARSQAAAKPSAPVAAKPQAPSTNRLAAASVTAPVPVAGGGNGSAVVGAAMKYLGARYVFGGTSPSGFDCSGFVWYIHNALGKPVSRGLWGQLNGGPRIPLNSLQPGDTVFFANTYMPGLSHAGIYIGGGRFIHASDESSGVKISSLSDSYWGPRYIGAARLY